VRDGSLELADTGLTSVLAGISRSARRRRRRRRSSRAARAVVAAGCCARWRPSRPRCSRPAARPPSGRAARRGSSRPRSPSPGKSTSDRSTRAPGSGRGTCVLRRVEHLEQRARGVARKSEPILSTSSRSTTGFIEPASRMRAHDPTRQRAAYVRRCPRISASSRKRRGDPDEVATQGRATDSPREVLPTPGGPTRASYGTTATAADRLQAALRPGERGPRVLHDPVLHVSRPSWSASRTARAAGSRCVRRTGGPRQLQDGVEPRADPAGSGLGRCPARLAHLAQGRLTHLVRQVCALDARPVVLRAVGLVLAELLADRGELWRSRNPAGLSRSRRARRHGSGRRPPPPPVVAGPSVSFSRRSSRSGFFFPSKPELLLQVEVGA